MLPILFSRPLIGPRISPDMFFNLLDKVYPVPEELRAMILHRRESILSFEQLFWGHDTNHPESTHIGGTIIPMLYKHQYELYDQYAAEQFHYWWSLRTWEYNSHCREYRRFVGMHDALAAGLEHAGRFEGRVRVLLNAKHVLSCYFTNLIVEPIISFL